MEDMIIRPVRVEDAEDVNEIRRQPGVRHFTTALTSERIIKNREFLERFNQNDHVFVIELANKVVGMAGLHLLDGKRRHVGEIGIMVHDHHHNKGYGKRLMQALIELADNELNLLRLELEVYADNEKAIRMYQNLGFVEEGRKRHAIYRNGTYHDSLVMGRVRFT